MNKSIITLFMLNLTAFLPLSGFAEDLALQKKLRDSIISESVKFAGYPEMDIGERKMFLRQNRDTGNGASIENSTAKIIGIETMAGFLSPFIVAAKFLEEISGRRSGIRIETKLDSVRNKALNLEDSQKWSRGQSGQDEYVDLSKEVKMENLGQKLIAPVASPFIGGIFVGVVSLIAYPVSVPYAVNEIGNSLGQGRSFWPALMGSLLGITVSYSSRDSYEPFPAYCSSIIGTVLVYNTFPKTKNKN